jgi:uncharacterized membrane protein
MLWRAARTVKSPGNRSKGEVLAVINGNPFIAAGEFGRGKSVAFASDCSPHWAPLEFCEWEHYGKFWWNLADFLTENGLLQEK